MSFFEVEFMLEKVMYVVNQRPLSMSNCGTSLCPNDLKPHFSSLPQESKTQSFIAGYESLRRTVQEFEQAWTVLYCYAIVGMKKWLADSVTLEPGDLVAVDDIRPGYQQLALVETHRPSTQAQDFFHRATPIQAFLSFPTHK